MNAAKCILTKPITLVSGRGGTGKTEVVSTVLKAVEESLKERENMKSKDKDDLSKTEAEEKKGKDKSENMNGPILYCAPTGKAASVIKKRVGSKAFTIHQVISSYKMYKRTDMSTPWKFSAVKIVAVDECSMVAIETIQWLLKFLLQGSELCKAGVNILLYGFKLKIQNFEMLSYFIDNFIQQ